MPRYTTLLLALATLSATAAASAAQTANQAVPGNSNYMQSQAAPIERAAPVNRYNGPNQRVDRAITVTRPAAGIVVRSARNGSVRTVSADAKRTELTVEHGVTNISVRHPQEHGQILVNLLGGQTALLKDGLYTFNADTNTVRVLKGEAAAFPGNADTKPIKVKEDHQLVFSGGNLRSVEVDPLQARADLLPGDRVRGEGFRGDGPYGDGYPYPYYGYPYGFYGDPYGFYSPYGYGYPFGFGIGFGYYGGFHGGFHGRR